MQEKIAVIGGGAMGTVFGSAFADAGFETTIVDVRADLVASIRENGLTVLREGASRRVSVAATTTPREVGVVDLVLFVVKSYHTAEAARSAAVLADSETVVATLQNGLGHGNALSKVFEPSRIVLGVTAESGTTVGPGAVEHPGHAVTFAGPYEGDRLVAAERFAGMLTRAGFHAEATPCDRERDLEEAGARRLDARCTRAPWNDLRRDARAPRDIRAHGRHHR